MTRDLLIKVAQGLAVSLILAMAGWLMTLYRWQAATEDRLTRAEERNSVLWQLAIAAHDERNQLRHELGMEPESWKQHFDSRLRAVTGE